MADKRMFSLKIVDSDLFLDMPLSSQCLYFHLSMRADDDGFVNNPKKIIKIIGAMYLIASLFFFIIYKGFISKELASEYLAGAVLLGAAPCTAMVFVWSKLTKGDSAYTLVQVASNDLIILIAYIPIVSFLLKIGNINIHWETLFLSILLFIVVPLILSIITRGLIIKKQGENYLNNKLSM